MRGCPQLVRAHHPDRLRDTRGRHHAGHTLREEQVVCADDLAEFAVRADRVERPVIARGDVHELIESQVADSRVRRGVTTRDGRRRVRARVVHDRVVPVRVRLREDALDALLEELRAVVHRRDDADERLVLHPAMLTPIHGIGPVRSAGSKLVELPAWRDRRSAMMKSKEVAATEPKARRLDGRASA